MNDGWLKRSILLRMVVIGGLSLALLIPSLMVMGLISDREQTRNSAIGEVSENWGQGQTIAGPILTLPFRKYIPQQKGPPRVVIEQTHILPDSLAIATTVSPEVRYRGIYECVLYNARLNLRGKFSLNALAALNIKPDDVVWDNARLAIGISDLKGINEIVTVNWDGKSFAAEPGVEAGNVLNAGISIKPTVVPEKREFEFATNIELNGSGDLQFVPVGKETSVRVASSWTSPSFIGRFLPERRTIRPDGFNAEWKILHLNRNFPQQWVGETAPASGEVSSHAHTASKLDGNAFGVKLLLPVDEYQKTMRSAKYAIMFIVLTFLSFFLTEVFNKKVVHPIQYALIGFAFVLFYCLLLSLSEQMAFDTAYSVSALGIIALVAGYTRAVLASTRVALTISAVLTMLYAFLFVILQQEDFALLVGSLGLFAILAGIMYLTRKIDWFAIGKTDVTT
jgi:inner membrane protein